MHKLVDYICEELEELESKAEKNGKLSPAEIQLGDTLAHFKKNLLKAEEMGDYSQADNSYREQSMARGRRGNVRRDAMGRYSRNMSYASDGLVEAIYDVMDELPEDARRDAQKLIKKIEGM